METVRATFTGGGIDQLGARTSAAISIARAPVINSTPIPNGSAALNIESTPAVVNISRYRRSALSAMPNGPGVPRQMAIAPARYGIPMMTTNMKAPRLQTDGDSNLNVHTLLAVVSRALPDSQSVDSSLCTSVHNPASREEWMWRWLREDGACDPSDQERQHE